MALDGEQLLGHNVLELSHPLLVHYLPLNCPAGRAAGQAQGPEREKAAAEGDLGTWRTRAEGGQAEAERKRSIERLGGLETRQCIRKCG